MTILFESILGNKWAHGHAAVMEVFLAIQYMDAKITSHPLGFIQATLFERGKEYRINFWGTHFAHPKTPNWKIHNHRFNFKSRIIAGQLLETQYSIKKDDEGAYDLYKVKYTENDSFLVQSGGRVSASATSQQIYCSGETYHLDADTFHSSETHAKLTVTVMEIGDAVSASPTVLGEANYKGEFSPYHANAISFAELKKTLDDASV